MSSKNEETLQKQITELKSQIDNLQEQCKAERTDTMNLYAAMLKILSIDNDEKIPSADLLSKLVESDDYSKGKSDIEQLLKKQISDLVKSVNFSIDSIEKSIASLDPKVEIHKNLKVSLDKYNCNNKAFGIDSQQSKLLKFLELYNVAFNELASRGLSNGENFNSEEVSKIGNNIQQLISEIDFPSSISDELTLLRYKLLSDVKIEELPKLAVKILELVVESYKIEREEAQTFLTSLNNSLSLFNSNFSSSIALVKDIHNQESQSNTKIDLAIDKISETIGQADTIQQLKDNIIAQITSIRAAMESHHSAEEKQNNYVKAIVKIQDRLKLMVDETDEFKQKLAQQKNRMTIDSLTKLNNKNAYDVRIDHEYKRWQRYHEPMSVALVDIDNFRVINERYGHPAGDRALKVIARALQSKIRETDFIARYLGEKFVFILLRTDKSDLESPLKKLNEVVRSIPFHFKDNRVAITISIGAAVFGDNDNPLTIMEKVESALKIAKQSGKNCYKIYE